MVKFLFLAQDSSSLTPKLILFYQFPILFYYLPIIYLFLLIFLFQFSFCHQKPFQFILLLSKLSFSIHSHKEHS